jgi:hypothetical protein
MRIVDVQQRGKRGKIVASRNRFGQYIKDLVPPNQPGTQSQRAAQANMTGLWSVWNALSDERMDAWWSLAERVRSRPTLAQSGRLDGPTVFRKVNTVLQTCGRPILLDPPPLPTFRPNPVAGFTIGERRGTPSMRLQLHPKVCWADRPPEEDLMLFSWAPCHPGRRRNNRYVFLGLLPAPVKGECDITAIYLNKLEQWRRLKPRSYHIHLENSRIFVRVWQQLNGWENELGMFRADARVPVRRWPR